MESHDRYVPSAGLSVPLIAVLDGNGAVLEQEQRNLVRFAIQQGAGANILFASGTTGEWDRLDNPRRQLVCRIAVEECRRLSARHGKAEAWAGVTARTRAETLSNISHALEISADAAVVAPLSIADADDPVDFVGREIGELFERCGRSIPVMLYDNADIAAPGNPPNLNLDDVARMSRLDYVRGVKVTAGKTVIDNYLHAARDLRLSPEFVIYVGNEYLLFDIFAGLDASADSLRRGSQNRSAKIFLPHGVVAAAANVMPREWQRAWQACVTGDRALMGSCAQLAEEFRSACLFTRGGRDFRPTIACIKAALVEMGVCSSAAVAPGTATLEERERDEFEKRFRELRRRAAATLEPGCLSRRD